MCGKKLDCPYCKEKVDLSAFKTNVWDAQQMLYLNMLDFVRYMVVWQPLLFGLVNVAYKILGLD
jgi:RING finger protein 121